MFPFMIVRKRTFDRMCNAIESSNRDARYWEERSIALDKELFQSQKNDMPHDPKTGRFMKKKKD